MSSLIEVKHLKKYYNKGEIKALDDVSVNIERGDVMVVIGPSGSGKSTLLRSLNLLEVPTAGEIDFDGVDIDWEYPRTTDGTKQQYEDFLLRLRRLLGGKLLTAAILAGVDSKNEPIRSAAEAIDFPAVELLDQINLMTYDCDGPIHSSYAFAESCLNYWLEARHFPPEKLTLGLPFYGRPFPGAFKDLLLADPDALEKDTVEMPHGSVHYNGRETLTKKVALAKERLLAGIMFWEISLDADDPQKSLLKVLGEAMNA